MLVFRDALRNAFQLGHGAAPLPLVDRTQLIEAKMPAHIASL
jgi:hypothetical protein